MAANTWRVVPGSDGEAWAIGPVRTSREEAERDAEHGSMGGALPPSPEWFNADERLPEEDVFVAVLYRRNGVLIPAVARRTAIAWVTPQMRSVTVGVDPEFWAPLPALPEEAQ